MNGGPRLFAIPRAALLSGALLTAALLSSLAGAAPASAAPERPSFAGLTLEDALLALQQEGVPLVFTSRVVRPEMRVEREPEGDSLTALLLDLLRPHGLGLRSGAGGRLLVVPGDQGENLSEDAPDRRFVIRDEIDVTSQGEGILGEDASQIFLDGDGMRALPEVSDDVLRGLKILPGTSGDDVAASFSVRGGRPDEVMITIDGLEIYEPYHLKDYSSALTVLAPETVAGLELLTGAFPAEYGDRMSGVLNITTVVPDRRRTQISLTPINIQSQTSGTGEKGAWLAALRGGSLELPFQVADEEDNPRFWDGFAKVERRLANGTDLRVNALVAGDRLDFAILSDDEIAEQFETSYENSYAWLTHGWLMPSGLNIKSRAFVSRVERDRKGSMNDGDEFSLSDQRALDAYGLAQDWSYQRSPRHVLRWGADLRALRIRYDYANSISFEDDNLLAELIGQEDERTIAFVDRRDGEQIGLYVADRIRTDGWTAELGLRFDENTVQGDNGQWSPRLQLSRAIGEKANVFAAWGYYYQSQRLYELQVEDGQTEFALPERTEHRSLGWTATLSGGRHGPLVFRAELYERRIRDPRVRWENLFDPISKVPELEADRVRIEPLSSESRGVELFLNGAAGKRLNYFASYTWSEVEDRIATADGVRTVPRSVDQRHAVKLNADLRLPWNWQLNTNILYYSGRPTTAVLTSPEVALGPFYGERLPNDLRVDLRLARSFELGRGEILFYLNIRNLANRENIRGFEVSIEDEDDELEVTQEAKTWGSILPTFGIRWSF